MITPEFPVSQRQSLRVMPLTRIDIRSELIASPAFIVGRDDKIILNPKEGAANAGKAHKGFFSRLIKN